MPDQNAPFVVFALPRSRTFWLSRFLTYGPWTCSHDLAPVMRSVEDVKSWLTLPHTGSVETGAVFWWRLARHYRPDLKIAVVRRDRQQVTDSLMAFGIFNRQKVLALMTRYDRALDVVARTPGCLSVGYDELKDESTCARLFQHCLGVPPDRMWWPAMNAQNLQANLPAQIAYIHANTPQLALVGHAATKALRYVCLRRQAAPTPDPDGVVIQEESLQAFWEDGQELMAQHCEAIGKPRDHFRKMNLPLWDAVCRGGSAQIMIARLNGRMLGYLTAVIVPSFDEVGVLAATQFSMFVSPDAMALRLGMRLQHAAIDRARRRGASKMYMRAGTHGPGRRLGTLYRRLGATDYGQMFELDLAS